MIKFKNLERGEFILDYPGGPNLITADNFSLRSERDVTLLALKMKEGTTSQGMCWPHEYGKEKERDSPL